MEFKGVVRGGKIVLEGGAALADGTKVRIVVESEVPLESFGERHHKLKGAAGSLPADLANQHDHYRLGTPKR